MDLTTEYLGLSLKNPLIAGASPVSRSVDSVKSFEDAGIAAIVVYSLFEEQIEHELEEDEHYRESTTERFAEATTFLPGAEYAPRGPQDYIDHVARIKRSAGIPVIASLNGTTRGGWLDYARMLEEVGVDGLELNIYHLATDPEVCACEVEDRYIELVTAVKESTNLPLSLKLAPFFSSLPHFAKRLDACGVDGLVLFNRFYQPDIDLETLEVQPDLVLSSHHEMRLPLRWVAILDPLLKASLAASTGVYSSQDVLKLLMVGADAVMLCATLLRYGPSIVPKILDGMNQWMQENEYISVRQMQGSMNHRKCENPAAFERANYMKALQSYR